MVSNANEFRDIALETKNSRAQRVEAQLVEGIGRPTERCFSKATHRSGIRAKGSLIGDRGGSRTYPHR